MKYSICKNNSVALKLSKESVSGHAFALWLCIRQLPICALILWAVSRLLKTVHGQEQSFIPILAFDSLQQAAISKFLGLPKLAYL